MRKLPTYVRIGAFFLDFAAGYFGFSVMAWEGSILRWPRWALVLFITWLLLSTSWIEFNISERLEQRRRRPRKWLRCGRWAARYEASGYVYYEMTRLLMIGRGWHDGKECHYKDYGSLNFTPSPRDMRKLAKLLKRTHRELFKLIDYPQ